MRHLTSILLLCLFAFLSSCKEQGQENNSNNLQVLKSNIIGGFKTDKFKSTVALVDDRGESFCTGFILDKKTIVTAAHCLSGQAYGAVSGVFVGSSVNSDGHDGKVYSINYTRSNVAYSQRFSASPIRQLPRFPFNSGSDFGYIVLHDEIEISEKEIVPVMKAKDADYYLGSGGELTAVGFGYTEVNANYNSKMGEKHTVDFYSTELFSDAFTAGEYEIKDTASGDSGGPIFAKDSRGDLVIVGITSASVSEEISWNFDLGDTAMGAYGRADVALKWLESDRLVYDLYHTSSTVNQKTETLKKALKIYGFNANAIEKLSEIYLNQGNITESWKLALTKPDGVNRAMGDKVDYFWRNLIRATVKLPEFETIKQYCQTIADISDSYEKDFYYDPPYESIYQLFLDFAARESSTFTGLELRAKVAKACFHEGYDYWGKIVKSLNRIKDRSLLLSSFEQLFQHASNAHKWIDKDQGKSLLHQIAGMKDEELAIELGSLAIKHIPNIKSVHQGLKYTKSPAEIARLKGHLKLAELLRN